MILYCCPNKIANYNYMVYKTLCRDSSKMPSFRVSTTRLPIEVDIIIQCIRDIRIIEYYPCEFYLWGCYHKQKYQNKFIAWLKKLFA